MGERSSRGQAFSSRLFSNQLKNMRVIVGIRGDSGYVSTRKPFGISVRYGFGQFWVPL